VIVVVLACIILTFSASMPLRLPSLGLLEAVTTVKGRYDLINLSMTNYYFFQLLRGCLRCHLIFRTPYFKIVSGFL
jgi:hypothetical protein